jgi:hypothetical protein
VVAVTAAADTAAVDMAVVEGETPAEEDILVGADMSAQAAPMPVVHMLAAEDMFEAPILAARTAVAIMPV